MAEDKRKFRASYPTPDVAIACEEGKGDDDAGAWPCGGGASPSLRPPQGPPLPPPNPRLVHKRLRDASVSLQVACAPMHEVAASEEFFVLEAEGAAAALAARQRGGSGSEEGGDEDGEASHAGERVMQFVPVASLCDPAAGDVRPIVVVDFGEHEQRVLRVE